MGFNGNIVNGGRPVSYDNPIFTGAIKQLRVNIFRIPGGIAAAKWNWREDKPSLSSLVNLNARILFVLNIDRTLQDQLEMLKAASDLGLLFDVEMGNEISNADNPALQKFHSSGAEYATFCKEWHDAIKARYSDCRVGLWGESKTELPNWTSEILSVYTPDALVSHIYPSDFAINTPEGYIDEERLYKHLERSFVVAKIDFSTKVWITETNVNPDHQNLLARGAHRKALVLMCNYFISRGVEIICINNIYGVPNGAFTINKFGVPQMEVSAKAFLKINR